MSIYVNTQKKNINFIGGGNMAFALVGGLIGDGYAEDSITITDHNAEALQKYADWKVNKQTEATLAQCDVLILAVKPQGLKDVCLALASQVQEQKPLIISVAAGVLGDDINRWLGGDLAVVRCMPNTPSLVNTGATGLFANTATSPEQRDTAESILRAVGITVWVDSEDGINAVTALSGSGPAYIFLVIEAMQAAGEKLGLAPDAARLLALQTALGASKLAIESPDGPAALRKRVTSPGGTTERGVAALEAAGLRGAFDDALNAAYARSGELAKLLGDN